MGDGPIRQVLEQKASKMERVVFTGWQDPESFTGMQASYV